MREQHDDVDVRAPAERLDRRAAGIARGRADDRGALAARGQRVVHEPRQQLHGEVLEGERRPVEQLGQEAVRPVLDQWHHGRVAERAVGFARHAGEVGVGERVADERAEDLDGDLGVGPAGQAAIASGGKTGQDSGT